MTAVDNRPHPGKILVTCAVLLLGISSSALAETTGHSSSGSQQPDLTPMSATYGASMDKGLSIDGSAIRTLEQQADGTWLYRFDVDSFIADITESVTFRWENGRIRPLEYRYALKGLMVSNRSRAMNFNWAADSISGSYEGDSFTMDMAENALDPLGFQLQMRQDLKAGKREMSYTVADDGDYDQDRFAVIGEEATDTPLGEMATLKVEKVRDKDSERETLMWFAPELDYLLVRLVQVEPDGSRYEVNLEDAELP
ncbi:DUF3108 domain-containing protein [Marinobacter zhanjiangensis]|uniref:Dehydrogenase n=1 Tax=Marinobacter zhanjiangensis TaxID=578215 RepID=A0ABQ3AT59_9GAMM|nr:DUF3108 domain-containing protein [Marinobacter zhanjiangensis]GGY65088.1 dehydrogenase [Marinobacter zhanjiangensis]